MDKRLIVIRHAHRDTTVRSLDNGLSEKGLRQVQDLVRYFERRLKSEREWTSACFFSSPKKRCRETLQPLADVVGKTVETKTELDEHGVNEKFAAVDLRVHRFLHWWTTDGDPFVIISAHGDIIPLMAYHLLGASLDVKKGSWLEIEWSTGQAHLLWFIRHFKDFF